MTAKKATRLKPRKGSRYHHGDLRLALLTAAEQELDEKGLENFSLRGVAKRAGVSHAAPAHHFQDANGLLTSLAALGFERFVKAQEDRQTRAEADAVSQLVAAGLGYVEFAMQHPALFRLMFSSARPDYENVHLQTASYRSFDKLVQNVRCITDKDPHEDESAMLDVTAAWVTVHGIADLINAGQSKLLCGLSKTRRDAAIAELIQRSIGRRANCS